MKKLPVRKCCQKLEDLFKKKLVKFIKDPEATNGILAEWSYYGPFSKNAKRVQTMDCPCCYKILKRI